jgi:hypothetical protein
LPGSKTRAEDEVNRGGTERLFWELVAELMTVNPDLEEGTIMNGRCVRVGKEFLALVDYIA